jgi:hypothetical protein
MFARKCRQHTAVSFVQSKKCHDSTRHHSHVVSRMRASQSLSSPLARERAVISFTLHNCRPIFPFACDFSQNVAHDLCASHEAVLFAFENANFAFAHEFAEPAYVVDGNARVFAAMVDDDGAVNIFVAKADCLLGFEADHEIRGGVGVGCCAVPDGKGEAFVKGALMLAFCYRQLFLVTYLLLVAGVRVVVCR